MPQLFNVLTLLRLVAFMVVIYVGLGWLVERRSGPESKLRYFFRTVCLPVTKLVEKFMVPGTPKERVFRMSFLVVVLFWMGLIAVHRLVQPEIPVIGP